MANAVLYTNVETHRITLGQFWFDVLGAVINEDVAPCLISGRDWADVAVAYSTWADAAADTPS